MKSVISMSTTAAAFVSLAIPVWLSAQDAAQHDHPKHHHYKVVEMGTFGGPTSSIDATGASPKLHFQQDSHALRGNAGGCGYSDCRPRRICRPLG